MDILDLILDAAKAHGEDGDPDMEVGDLQQLARDLWTMLTPEQRTTFHIHGSSVIDWNEFIDNWLKEEQHGQGQDLHRGGPESGQDNNRPHSSRRSRRS